jgi:signal transduction histidine kinase
MKKHLGNILIEKGYISQQELDRALDHQMRKVLGGEQPGSLAANFLLEVARKKYNNRSEFYLGRILTEMKLLPETRLQEALEIQRASAPEKPRGRLEALNQLIVRMNDSYNLIDLLHQVLVLAAGLVDAEASSLIIHDSARDTLVILMPTGPTAEAVRDREIPKNQGIAGWVYENGESLIVNDTAAEPRFFPAIDRMSGYASRQILCVPLTVKSRRLGAVEVVNKRGRDGVFSAEDQFLLEMFSTQAAIAIENTRLALALSRLEEELPLEKKTAVDAEVARAGLMLSEAYLGELKRSFVPLQGYAARMRESPSAGKVEKYSAYIDREMARLVTRAEDIVQFLRNDIPLLRETVSLRELFGEMAARTWVECRLGGIAFSWSVEGEPSVEADRERLLRSLEALLRSSRQAMPGGGTVCVSARAGGDGRIEIRYADSGPGIPLADSGRLFDPFPPVPQELSPGNPRAGAAGLGLAMARRVVEAHGGTIRAEEAGGPACDTPGAAFTIVLPAAQAS